MLVRVEVPMVLLVSMHMFHAASSSCWHLNNTENRTDVFSRISLLPPQSSFFRQKLTVINPLLLQRCITLMLHPWMCRCSCPGLCVQCVCRQCFHGRVFTKLYFSSFSSLSEHLPASRLLRSLFLGSLIDMQQPTSLNDVFYAPWSSALSASLVFPFLG